MRHSIRHDLKQKMDAAVATLFCDDSDYDRFDWYISPEMAQSLHKPLHGKTTNRTQAAVKYNKRKWIRHL